MRNVAFYFFFFSSRRRHTRFDCDWSSDVCSSDLADRVLESWAVADALAALRPDHRQVLLETYYRGRSVAEAAIVLGVPAGTVKSRTFYALRALKLALEERGLAP